MTNVKIKSNQPLRGDDMVGVLCLFGLLAFLSDSHAENGMASCNIDRLTQSCAMLSPSSPEKITLPDGSYIPNFAAILEADKEKNRAEDTKSLYSDMTNADKKVLDEQFSAMQILDQVDDSKLSPKAKLAIADALPMVLDSNGRVFDPSQRFIVTPWPLDSSEAKAVSTDDVKNALQHILTSQQIQNLAAIAKSFPNLSDMMLHVSNDKAMRFARASQNVTPKQENDARGAVDFVKKSITSYIRQGRPDSELSKAEKDAIKKVSAIIYTSPSDPTLKNSAICLSPVPNAFYDPENNSINICPNFYSLPKATMMAVLGHEMGHSIDPCLSQFGLTNVNKSALKAMGNPLTGAGVPTDIKNNNDRFSMLMSLYQMNSNHPDMKQTAYPFSLLYSKDTIAYFEKAGVLSAVTKDIAPSHYFLNDVKACLKNKGFRTSITDLDSVARTVTEGRKQSMGNEYNQKADENRIISAFTEHPECVSTQKSSQMGEAMADNIGSYVEGDYLKGKTLSTPAEKLAPIAFFASLSCLERFKIKHQLQVDTADIKVIEDALQEYARLSDPHPGSKNRVDQIFLQDPHTEAALGCDPSNAKPCTHNANGMRANEETDQSGSSSSKSVR